MNFDSLLSETIHMFRCELSRLRDVVRMRGHESIEVRRKAVRQLRVCLRLVYIRSGKLAGLLGAEKPMNQERLNQLTERIADAIGDVQETRRAFVKKVPSKQLSRSIRLAV